MSSTGATLSGSCSGVSGSLLEVGFVWGTSVAALNGSCIGSCAETFTGTLKGLSPQTTYYYKAYATVKGTDSSVETFYGDVKSFATTSSHIPTGYLELPAAKNGASLVSGTFRDNGARNYSYCYDKNKYASIWTAYPLTYSHTQGEGHTSSWRWNPDIDQSLQINVKSSAYGANYGDDTYSRGHMCPNADRKNSDTMNGQTYYLTNQLPQIQNGFNGGIWSALEGSVRTLTQSTDTVYVAVGPCYNKTGESKQIAYLTATSESIVPSQVPVPNYYYKVLLKVRRQGNEISAASAVGIWLEHKVYDAGEKFTSHTVSVDQIEAWTGIDFFANLPSDLQSAAEQNSNWTTFSDF